MDKNYSIFVFGSNLAGRHGKGAALCALRERGAIYGQGVGRQGHSYAIPTKDWSLKTLPLHHIGVYVEEFIAHAKREHGDLFQVTRIGCGLAGYKDSDIASMFKGAPFNCILPIEWKGYLVENDHRWHQERCDIWGHFNRRS